VNDCDGERTGEFGATEQGSKRCRISAGLGRQWTAREILFVAAWSRVIRRKETGRAIAVV